MARRVTGSTILMRYLKHFRQSFNLKNWSQKNIRGSYRDTISFAKKKSRYYK